MATAKPIVCSATGPTERRASAAHGRRPRHACGSGGASGDGFTSTATPSAARGLQVPDCVEEVVPCVETARLRYELLAARIELRLRCPGEEGLRLFLQPHHFCVELAGGEEALQVVAPLGKALVGDQRLHGARVSLRGVEGRLRVPDRLRLLLPREERVDLAVDDADVGG